MAVHDVWHFFSRGNVKERTRTVCRVCRYVAPFSQLRLHPFTPERSAQRALDPKFLLLNINYSFATSTANPNLRFHLENHHEDAYVKACDENGWPMQLPKRKLRLETEHRLKQTTLDSSLRTPTDRVPFSRAAFHRSLINFIVADDQSIKVIECREF